MPNKQGAWCTDKTWVGRSNCASCAVRHSVLFADLQPAELSRFVEPIDNFLFEAGARVYQPSDPPRFVYTLRRGLVKLEQSDAEGSARIVRLLGIGDVAGLEALLDGPYRHTATALRRVDLCRIPVSVIEALKSSHPALNEQLARRWEDSLETADYWITRLSSGTARQRAAWLVRYLIRMTGSTRDCVELLSSADMAAAIGTTVETLSRTMAEMKQSGVLTGLGARRYRCDMDAIRALSERAV